MYPQIYMHYFMSYSMTYVITHYQDTFITEQVRIGTTVTRDWSFYFQTPVDQLRQVYSRPDFDPETRHYCLKDNTVVGFCTSKIEKEDTERASLEFPLVLPEHRTGESLLFERAVEVLSQKGVKTIYTRVSDKWGRTVQMAEKWGYTAAHPLSILYSMDTESNSFPQIQKEDTVTPYDHERDFQELVTIFATHFNMTPEEARANFEALEKAGDTVIAHLVIRNNETIRARVLALRDEEDSTQARAGAVYVTESYLLNPLMISMIKICKEKGIRTVVVPLLGDQLAQKERLIPFYESLGFTHACTIDIYEKLI